MMRLLKLALIIIAAVSICTAFSSDILAGSADPEYSAKDSAVTISISVAETASRAHVIETRSGVITCESEYIESEEIWDQDYETEDPAENEDSYEEYDAAEDNGEYSDESWEESQEDAGDASSEEGAAEDTFTETDDFASDSEGLSGSSDDIYSNLSAEDMLFLDEQRIFHDDYGDISFEDEEEEEFSDDAEYEERSENDEYAEYKEDVIDMLPEEFSQIEQAESRAE